MLLQQLIHRTTLYNFYWTRWFSSFLHKSNALPYNSNNKSDNAQSRQHNSIYELDDDINPLIQHRPSHIDMSSSTARNELLSMIKSMKKYDGGSNDIYNGAPSATLINKLRQSSKTIKDTTDQLADTHHKLARAQEYKLFKYDTTTNSSGRCTRMDYKLMNELREKQKRKQQIIRQLKEDEVV